MRRLIGASVAAAIAAMVSVAAQQAEQVAAPVDVKVAAASLTPGAAAQISGTSVPLGSAAVKIEITKPDRSLVSLSGPVSPQGTYTVSFTQTTAAGTYGVKATSPDGKTTATTSFRVVGAQDIGALAGALVQSLTDLAGSSGQTIGAVTAAVDGKPDFPDKGAFDQRLAALRQQMGQLPGRLSDMKQALDQLAALTRQYPGLSADPRLADVAQSLGENRDKATAMIAQAKDLTGRVPKASGICDTMDTAAEALNFVSLVFDFFGSWPLKVTQLLIDKGLPEEAYNFAVPVENRTSASKAGFIESMKGVGSLFAGGAGAAKDFIKGPFGLAADGAQYLLGLGFDKLCERFVGPIDGVFSVDATAGGKPSWGYKTSIKGRLFLRFEKKQNTGAGPVPLTGEFEGAATKFDMYEDLFAVNTLNKNSVLYRKLVTPIAAGDGVNWAAQKAGRMASALALPNYFLVPVTGTMSGDQVTIEVAPAAQMDFRKDLKGTAWYVSIPFAAMIPIVQKFDIPMQNAQFILSRALRNKATVAVATAKRPQGFLLKTIAQTFTRQEVVSNGEVTVKWNLNVKACNPECP